MGVISLSYIRVERLAAKYGLEPLYVSSLYLRTPYDVTLLERACLRMADGEDFEDVCVYIMTEINR